MNALNAYLTLINTFRIKLIFGKINSGKFRPKSCESQFPVPVKPEQEFEFPFLDWTEPEC